LTVSKLSVKISILLDMSFPVAWLESKAEGDKLGRTNREVQREASPLRTSSICTGEANRNFETPSLADQLYARRLSHTRRQTLPGAVSQMWAGLTHYVSPERLGSIARGVPRVMIITGDEDWMVDPRGSERIWDGLVSGLGVNPASDEARKCRTEGGRIQGVEMVRWEKTGHPIHIQWPNRFNAQLEMLFGGQVVNGTEQ
jgi:pimeloyl-ACP methyl ester carboxylesterase